MDRRRVEILRKDTVFKGYFQVDRYDLRHESFAGGLGEPVRREVFERGHAVAVLLYDPDREATVLIEQFRIGAHLGLAQPWFRDGDSAWLFEVVAGIVEAGETAEEVARREALEEAGCEIDDLFEVFRFFATPGACTESLLLYCGRVDSSKAGGLHGLAAEGEDIKVHVLPLAEVWSMLDSGRIINATALIALQWLRLHAAEAKARWSGSAAG